MEVEWLKLGLKATGDVGCNGGGLACDVGKHKSCVESVFTTTTTNDDDGDGDDVMMMMMMMII